MDILSFKRRFDPILKRLIRQKIQASAGVTSDVFVREIVDYAERLLVSGGKRVRPYMAYIAYKAAGGKQDHKALKIFTGLEFFHAFALVHDDIMDRGIERHGLPTAHRYVTKRLQSLKRIGDAKHLGESQAILLGDLLFNWANEQVQGTICAKTFARMANEVIVGQMLDVDGMARASISDDLIIEKMLLKTASYTFVHPMSMGAQLARGGRRMANFAVRFGLPLGLAFQIQDDLLDLTAPIEKIGKTAFADLREGQHTVFTQFIRERGSPKQRRQLARLIRTKLTDKDRTKVSRVFNESGALEHGRALIEVYFEEAERTIAGSGLNKGAEKSFYELVDFIRNRGA